MINGGWRRGRVASRAGPDKPDAAGQRRPAMAAPVLLSFRFCRNRRRRARLGWFPERVACRCAWRSPLPPRCGRLAEQRCRPAAPRLPGHSTPRRAAVATRDAFIGAGRESVLVWGREGEPPALLWRQRSSFSIPASPAQMHWRCRRRWTTCPTAVSPFALTVAMTAMAARAGARPRRGRYGGGVAGERRPQHPIAAPIFGAIWMPCRIPVWLRDSSLALTWGNRAFVAGGGASDVAAARGANRRRSTRSERDLAASARARTRPGGSQALRGDQRSAPRPRLHRCSARRAARFVGMADRCHRRCRLRKRGCSSISMHMPTRLDKLATAVAIFGRDQRLTFHNRAFVAAVGPVRKMAGHASQPMARFSTGCARRASCPSSATIRPGSARALPLYDQHRRISSRRSCGICPAARPCAWWRSRIRSAASPSCTKTSPKSSRWRAPTTR